MKLTLGQMKMGWGGRERKYKELHIDMDYLYIEKLIQYKNILNIEVILKKKKKKKKKLFITTGFT